MSPETVLEKQSLNQGQRSDVGENSPSTNIFTVTPRRHVVSGKGHSRLVSL